MKLIIRDEKPEEPEETIELWLERHITHRTVVSLMSRRGNGVAITVANLHPDRMITGIGGNFSQTPLSIARDKDV